MDTANTSYFATSRLLTGLLFLLIAWVAPASAAPKSKYSQAPGYVRADDRLTTTTSKESWFFGQFAVKYRTDNESITGLHPFFSIKKNFETQEKQLDILWPLYSKKYKPKTYTSTERTSSTIFPLYYSTKAERGGKQFWHRYFIPFYWQGDQDTSRPDGDYFILFPFIWWADNARLVTPIFPPRPQTFAGIWPLMGVFENWWGRDKITWVLWPIFGKSEKFGEEDGFVVRHFIWPFFSYIKGPKASGFRVWPLYATAKKEGEFKRSYWLWPLGHDNILYDKSGQNPPERVTLFLPFYGKARTNKFKYDLVFPFYGKLEMKGRKSRGYALAIYNETDDLRKGVRNHRLFWFFIRWTTRIPVDPQFLKDGEAKEAPTEGGGFFPFYLRRSNDKQYYKTVVWPFYHRRISKYETFTFDRKFFFPFYARFLRQYKDGTTTRNAFFLPFYRHWETKEGEEYTSYPHMFWYTKWEPADRNWAPTWTIWERWRNKKTNEFRTRLFKTLYDNQRDWFGVQKKKINLGLIKLEKIHGPNRPSEAHTSVLFGLVSRHRLGEKTWVEVCGLKL